MQNSRENQSECLKETSNKVYSIFKQRAIGPNYNHLKVCVCGGKRERERKRKGKKKRRAEEKERISKDKILQKLPQDDNHVFPRLLQVA